MPKDPDDYLRASQYTALVALFDYADRPPGWKPKPVVEIMRYGDAVSLRLDFNRWRKSLRATVEQEELRLQANRPKDFPTPEAYQNALTRYNRRKQTSENAWEVLCTIDPPRADNPNKEAAFIYKPRPKFDQKFHEMLMKHLRERRDELTGSAKDYLDIEEM